MLARCLIVVALAVAGCAVNPATNTEKAAPKSALSFLDVQGFDDDLSASLAAQAPRVEVSFYDRIVPSALPERLRKWMASVEAGGGKVKVTPPPSTVTARSPLLLISAIGSLWTANNIVREASSEARFRAARAYDGEVILKQDEKGDTVVDKVIFVRGTR